MSTEKLNYNKNALDLFRIIATVQVFLGHLITHYKLENAVTTKIIYFVQGVPILFALCGFLAAMSVERHNTFEWLKRRAIRILPAFWACIIVNTAIFLVIYSVKPTLVQAVIYGATQFLGLNFYTGGWLRGYGVGVPNGVLWTIPVQIQFFLLVPFIHKFLKKRSFRDGALLVGGLTAFSICVEYGSAILPEMIAKLIGVTVLPYLYFLVAGMLVWYHRETIIPALVNMKWYILAAYCIWKVCEQNFGFPRVLNGVMYNTISTLLICALIFAFSFSFSFRTKIDLTYGFYLYHMVFMNIAVHFGFATFKPVWVGLSSAAAIVVLTGVFSYLSQKFVENPVARLVTKKGK